MSAEKLYYVRYTGAGVVAVARAGKFMPGTGTYLGEAEARALVGREDFVVVGLGAEAAKPPQPELARRSYSWRSERTQCDTRLSRWGHAGRPVLVIPPEGGDAEEIERMQLIGALRPLLDAGKIKVYSCDSVASRALVAEEGLPQHRMWLMNMFQEYLAREVVPAIRDDGAGNEATVIAAGAALGAMHAAALVCRYPEIFSHALCASGTYRLEPLLKTSEVTEDLNAASPLHLLPRLAADPRADLLRTRFVLIASGEGRGEDLGESWTLAKALGDKGVPNRVDPWGNTYHRDWRTWGEMFPQYLAEWAGQ